MDTETFNITSSRNRWYLSTVIGVTIILITVLHFLTPVDQIVWHETYQRLYYIPIIVAALLFGLKGGLTASVFTTVIYSPHTYIHWQQGDFEYPISQYAEMVIFILVGGVMGTLGDRLRKAREQAERNADQRRKAYDELQSTFQQLLQAEKLTSLGELSAGIVHEVRNPLASIKGAIEILEDELVPDSPRREFAALAIREIERLDTLVGEFLRFARPAKLTVEPNDLNGIVESVVSLVENQARSRHVVIEKRLHINLAEIWIDGEQIRQVLLNLAVNALQAVGDGGHIIFRTEIIGDWCVVEVRDSGGGVNEEILSKIFDPFVTTKEKGVGLGLSIAHKIVTEHGGKLDVSSGKTGAIFKMTLPLNGGSKVGSRPSNS